MKGTSAKIVYAIGLFILAACAVIPRPSTHMLTAELVTTPLSTEGRLARAISERIAIEASDAMHDYRLDELTAEIAGLRYLAFEDDAEGARSELIDALAEELSAALAYRAHLSARGGEGDSVTAADRHIRGLTAAINAEVRRIDI